MSELMAGATIASAATHAGLSVHAVRYYESVGMIPPVARNSAGRRVFDAEAMAWLDYAVCLRSLGMPVRQVAGYVSAATSKGTGVAKLRLMKEHLGAMQRRRAELDRYIKLVQGKVAAMEHGR